MSGGPRPFPVDTQRTAIAIAYRNTTLVADQIAPYYPVGSEKFSYLKHTVAGGFTVPNTLVGRKSDPNPVSFSATEVTDRVAPYGLEDFIPQSDIDAAPKGYDPVDRATVGIMDLVLLDREKRTADLFTTEANYSTNKTVLTNAQRFGTVTTGVNPVTTIQDAIDAMLFPPTHALMSIALWNYLKQCDEITKALFGNANTGKIATLQEFASIFGLNEVIIGKARINTNKKGQALSLSRCWGNDIILYARNDASPETGTFAQTARHGDRIVGSQQVPKRGLKGGTEIWAGEEVKEFMASEHHGWLIKNCRA